MARNDRHETVIDRFEWASKATLLGLVISFLLVIYALEDLQSWSDRTAIGKLGLVVWLPFTLIALSVGVVGTLIFGVIVALEYIPYSISKWYQRRAFKHE